MLTEADGVLLVQYQLPVRLWKSGDAAANATSSTNGWSVEWDEEALLAPKGHMSKALNAVRVKWIGTPPVAVPPEDEEAVTRLLETMSCIPVFLPPATHRAYYDGYCRDTLWPVFHNVSCPSFICFVR